MFQCKMTWFTFTLHLFLLYSLVPGISGKPIRKLKVGNSYEPRFNVSGLMSAVLTPLNDDQTVNLEVIPAYAAYLINNNIKSILVGGSSGEHMALSVKDRKGVIDAWIEANEDIDMHIQAQVGGAPFADVIELAKYCNSNGVHSILTLPDLYFKPSTVEDLVSYVDKVAKAAPNLPVFYYHIPKSTNVNIKMPEFVKAATESIPNFKGIKFTATDLVEAAQVLKVLKGDRKILLGGEHLLAPATLLGLDTCVSPAINLFPGLMRGIQEAIGQSDVTKARKLQDKLSSTVFTISSEGGRIPAMKVAMEFLTGIKMGPPALPKQPVSDAQRNEIYEKLKYF